MGVVNLAYKVKSIITEENNSFSFSIENLIENQKHMISKYKFPEETECKMLERFYPQIMEEVQEYLYEVNNQSMDNEKLAILEIMDIYLYIGSVITHLIVDYNLNKDHFKKIILEELPSEYKTKLQIDKFNDVISEILFLNIRRQYPERKYHKKLKELSKDEKELRRFSVLLNLVYILKYISSTINKRYSKYSAEELNTLITEKSQFNIDL
ncbi:hypothetical protein FPHOBKDP_00100 [Listeria phage LPJP1]|nr:hypothetical protein FPHOBKDP_00100 [Listeria phage LPJP1]